MSASQVVLYFDRSEDAIQFTIAASSVLSADEPEQAREALAQFAHQLEKVRRIRTEQAQTAQDFPQDRCA